MGRGVRAKHARGRICVGQGAGVATWCRRVRVLFYILITRMVGKRVRLVFRSEIVNTYE